MYLKIIIALLISFSLFAKEVNVTYKRISYTLVLTEKTIQYKDQYTDLKLEKKKCSEHLFRELHTTIEQYLSHPFPVIVPNSNLTFTIDKKVFPEMETTNRARYFIKFFDHFKSLKIEEGLNCKK